MSFSLLLALFLVIVPIFGKSIDYQESIILHGAIILFFCFSYFHRSHPFKLHKKFIIFETVLTLLYIVSTVFAKNIGFSYYGFFRFLFTLTLLNLSLTNIKDTFLSKFIHYSALIYGIIFLLNKFQLITLLPRPFYDNFILQIWGHSYLADFIIIAIPIVIYKIIYHPPKKILDKVFHYFSLLFFLSILILTNSRSATISIIIGIFFLLLPKIKMVLKPLILVSIIFVIAFIANLTLFQQRSLFKSPDGNRFEYWQQAFKGFLDSPLIGNGPNNFFYLNKKFESQANTNTNYAHNYILESLALNGLPYTFIFFCFIILSLKYQNRRRPLNFTIGLITLINTTLDPSWNSLGIFCLSLFYIFYQNPSVLVPLSKSTSSKLPTVFSLTILIICCFYYLTKSTADILYINNQKSLSLRFDPINLDNSLSLEDQSKNFTISLYSHNLFLYRELIRTTPLPESEAYYFQLFSLSPKENLPEYTQLANYYFTKNQNEKLISLLALIKKNIDPTNYSLQELMPLAQIYYQIALKQWQNHIFETAISNFKEAVYFSNGWGDFQIELANAYWSYGQKELALNQLQTECKKITPAFDSCQKYLLENKDNLPLPGKQLAIINSLDPGYFPLSDSSLQTIAYNRQLINNTPLPQSEDYYYQIFAINPRENLDLYYQLASYYLTQKQYDKLTKFLFLINDNINTNRNILQQILPLAKIYYEAALIEWQNGHRDQAVFYFQNSVRFSNGWGEFQIELANAYWSNNQKDLALNQLQVECKKYPSSKEACQKYLFENKNELPSPGIRKDRIDLIRVNSSLSNTSLQQISDLRKLINNNSLPQSEEYFYQIFTINPSENFDLYHQLASYYLSQKQNDKLAKLLALANTNINAEKTLPEKILPLAKISYYFALQKWQEQKVDEAIKYFQQAVRFSRSNSDFNIELANAYWSLGQKDLALNQLNIACKIWSASFDYCQEYLKKHEGNLLSPGTTFMTTRIDSLTPYPPYIPGQM